MSRPFTAPRSPGGSSYRADLEGLRALAVVLILLTHFAEVPIGGFVALDAFFVLSGFLITGLLVNEYTRSRRISLPTFYVRRFRRLAPAAAVVIAVTVLAGFLVFGRARAESILVDGVWAALVSANWNFVLNGTDYFATWAPQSPLLHYWSLAVEEQFYLVWPLLVLVGFGIARAVARRRRGPADQRVWPPSSRAVVALVAVVAAASFAWGVVESELSPGVAYLSTLTRAWELALGALLFLGAAHWRRIPDRLRPVLGWLGVAVLVTASFVLTPQTPYPGVAALLPTLATAAIIVAGEGGPSHVVLLSNPVSRFLGRISYSLYLWHWPVFVFLAALVGHDSPWYLAGAIPLALVLATASHYGVEEPVRRSRWLEPRARRTDRRGSEGWPRWVALGLAAAALVTTAVVLVLPRDSVAVAGVSASTAVEPGAAPAVPEWLDGLDQVTAALGAASSAVSWPEPVAEAIDAGDAAFGGALARTCITVDAANEDDCVIGDASLPRTAVVVGDSVALAWVPALAGSLNEQGYRVRLLTGALCPFADLPVTGTVTADPAPGFPATCDDHRRWTLERIAALRPAAVIVSDAEVEMLQLIPEDRSTAQARWTEGLERSLAEVGDARTVVLMTPPRGQAVATCYTRVASPSDCAAPVSETWFSQLDAVTEAVAASPSARLVETRDLFCASADLCPAFAGGTLVRADEQHITDDYATAIAPIVSERVRAALEG
ncbi:acyltransferase family protein [Rathayibacter sp. VKM Ac-2928]|uniref:acyltransferase family protein n=1 Tax=Rathayibacter sp. VKM Ac-2928 TaxID=2929479 RepID=UPI001FB2553E|nr:acyltransferase family protein [Rathayibacter sp. VKM Ac-2928]MCJ1683244.1 acyltransferase [Rathayibacter sp. VKM Ac-2928]